MGSFRTILIVPGTSTSRRTETVRGPRRIYAILAGHPEPIDLVHSDIADPLDWARAPDATGEHCYKFFSRTVVRVVNCQTIEDCSLREIVVRIDDSDVLRL